METTKNILIISLGFTPDVFRSTIQSFKQDLPSVNFEKIVVVCNTNLKKGEQKKHLETAIENSGIPKTSVKKVFSNSDDLITKADNLEFFRLVFDELEKAKKNGFKVFVNIAGGRKQMSALLLAAAYLSGAEKIFHTFFGKDSDGSEQIGLIEIPHLHLDRLLQSVVQEIDTENRFDGTVAGLIKQVETEEAFNLLNEYLDEQSRYKSLKEQFAAKRNLYQSMLEAAQMIIRNILQDKLMFQPEFQYRIKDFESFYKKILRKEEKEETICEPFDRFCDVAGLRVIFYNSDDLEKAVKLVEDSDDFVNFADGTKLKGDDKSKAYGYRAVHLDARLNPEKRCHLKEYSDLSRISCEMQFTTVFAHAWSKTHHALSYKDDRDVGLSEDKQKELDNAFTVAAANLEDIENKITRLTKEFYPKRRKK